MIWWSVFSFASQCIGMFIADNAGVRLDSVKMKERSGRNYYRVLRIEDCADVWRLGWGWSKDWGQFWCLTSALYVQYLKGKKERNTTQAAKTNPRIAHVFSLLCRTNTVLITAMSAPAHALLCALGGEHECHSLVHFERWAWMLLACALWAVSMNATRLCTLGGEHECYRSRCWHSTQDGA